MLCTIKRRDVTLQITLAIRAPVATKTDFIECVSKYLCIPRTRTYLV